MTVITQLNAAANRNYPTKVVKDLLYDQPGTLKLFNEKAHVKTGQGGTLIALPIETAAITAASVGMFDGGNQTITFAQDDILTTLEFQWKFGYVYTFMTDIEMTQNASALRILNIADSKVKAAYKAARQLLNTQILTGVHTNANDIHGLTDVMDTTYTTYGGIGATGGIDLSNAAYGPYVVAVGGTINTMTKDVINEAFSATWENDSHVNVMLANPQFRQQVISLCLPQQRFNEGASNWSIGPNKHPNWMGMAEVNMDRNMSAIKVCYGLNMDTHYLAFHWAGDGMKKSGWYDLRDTVGTMAYVLKFAIGYGCNDPNENFKITWV